MRNPWSKEVDLARANPEFKLPVILSANEVRRSLAKVPELDHLVCLTTIYSCGQRLGEGLRLQVRDIDSERMMLHIRAAKGNRDRNRHAGIRIVRRVGILNVRYAVTRDRGICIAFR